jgi:hypothetical protein
MNGGYAEGLDWFADGIALMLLALGIVLALLAGPFSATWLATSSPYH